MLPAEVLSAGPLIIAHQFESVDIVGGDFVDHFLMDNGNLGFTLAMFLAKACPPRCTPFW